MRLTSLTLLQTFILWYPLVQCFYLYWQQHTYLFLTVSSYFSNCSSGISMTLCDLLKALHSTCIIMRLLSRLPLGHLIVSRHTPSRDKLPAGKFTSSKRFSSIKLIVYTSSLGIRPASEWVNVFLVNLCLSYCVMDHGRSWSFDVSIRLAKCIRHVFLNKLMRNGLNGSNCFGVFIPK